MVETAVNAAHHGHTAVLHPISRCGHARYATVGLRHVIRLGHVVWRQYVDIGGIHSLEVHGIERLLATGRLGGGLLYAKGGGGCLGRGHWRDIARRRFCLDDTGGFCGGSGVTGAAAAFLLSRDGGRYATTAATAGGWMRTCAQRSAWLSNGDHQAFIRMCAFGGAMTTDAWLAEERRVKWSAQGLAESELRDSIDAQRKSQVVAVVQRTRTRRKESEMREDRDGRNRTLRLTKPSSGR